jgi:hypothetical protein
MGLFKPLYAVYPGPVTLLDGVTVKIWTAADLASAYGVADEPYLVVNSSLEEPQGLEYFKYLHLKPRSDDFYENIKYVAEDDGQVESWRPDFDSTKKYIQETDPRHIYPDDDSEKKLHDNDN